MTAWSSKQPHQKSRRCAKRSSKWSLPKTVKSMSIPYVALRHRNYPTSSTNTEPATTALREQNRAPQTSKTKTPLSFATTNNVSLVTAAFASALNRRATMPSQSPTAVSIPKSPRSLTTIFAIPIAPSADSASKPAPPALLPIRRQYEPNPSLSP